MKTDSRRLVLDRYTLLERLGAGAFGTVWLAHDEQLQREVAIKRIQRSSDDGREERRRAKREAIAAARLSHPAIVALYEAGADEDAYYLVSEPVRGSSLAELFASRRIDDRELLRVGAVLCEALAHAHARGVIHRDVKPQNVIVPDEATAGGAPAKLTDFGVARIAGDQPLTRTGDIVGTFAYMAPEQAQGRPANAASDLYSLALTIYEGLAGFNPVRGTTPAVTAQLQGEGVPPLERERKDLPRAVCRSIDRALSVDPARRGSLVELRAACAAALSGDLPRSHRRKARPLRPGQLTVPRQVRAIGGLAAGTFAFALLTSQPALAATPTRLWFAAAASIAVGLLPRAGWVAVGLTLVGWLCVDGAPGTAVLVALALAPVPTALRSTPWLWCAPALAPLLGLVGLALAFPALAARLGGVWQRSALGALGLWWLILAEAAFGRRLLFGAPPGTQPPQDWQDLPLEAIAHAVVPLLIGAELLLVALWSLAAASAPLLIGGGALTRRALGAIAWATALIAGTGLAGERVGVVGTTSLLGGGALALCVGLLPPPGRATARMRHGVP
ncbi:MAG TPA: serine/threonine-protein kinase [Solirubrobacteraceae bacterium]|nr:serine/threonine-protein kinase [Solirubrobacteraceae bacterium]